jgi:small subunit ribosomal protein S7
MSRRRDADKRERVPDPKYNSELIAKVINYVMRRGKKSTAEKIVYGAIEEIRAKMKDQDPVEVLIKAIDNIKPRVEVRSRRVGGATYQVPVDVSPDRQMALALRWLINFAGTRKGMPMKKAMAQELLDAYQNQGNAVKKRDDTHKMAQANKVFAHYAW